MDIIHFYDKNRNTIISLSEFEIQINEPNFNNFISFQVDAAYSFAQISIRTECLEIDFTKFLLGLQKMKEMEIKKISFLPSIEKNIEMTFELTKFGHIEVGVKVCSYIDKAIFQFEYEIDHSFLPELIDEFEKILT